MATVRSAFDLHLDLPAAGSRRLVHELHRQLKEAIADGRLHPGLRLPSTRALADLLGVSRNSVMAAYEHLLGEGYLQAARGSGHVVAAALPAPKKPSAVRAATVDPPRDERLNPVWRGAAPQPVEPPDPPRWDFRLGVPDQAGVDFVTWRRLSARCLRGFAREAAVYDSPQGEPALREAIAAHVSATRAVAGAAADVLVTGGARQAFDLLARVLVTPGRTVVAVEDPGFPTVREIFESAGAKLVGVPVDDEGLVVERLPKKVDLICVTPSHQFPLGCALSALRRKALLEAAARTGASIIEDDYDGEFRYEGRSVDALQTLDRGGEHVFYVGTFSKTLFPALRLGYIVAPRWALPALTAAKQRSDAFANRLAQDTLAAFIAEGHLSRHVRRMHRVYDARRALVLDRLARDFDGWLASVPGVAGLHLAARTAPGLDAARLQREARTAGVGVSLLARYAVRPETAVSGLALGFGVIDEAGIARGLAALKQVFERAGARVGRAA